MIDQNSYSDQKTQLKWNGGENYIFQSDNNNIALRGD